MSTGADVYALKFTLPVARTRRSSTMMSRCSNTNPNSRLYVSSNACVTNSSCRQQQHKASQAVAGGEGV